MKSFLLLLISLLLPGLLFAQSPRFMDATGTLPVEVVTGQSMDVLSEDFDGDGDKDLVLAREVQKNWILWNDGQGNFAPDPDRAFVQVKTYPQGFGGEDSEDVAAFDADGDGDLDLLFVTEDTDLHEFFLNDGQGNFTLAPYQFPRAYASNALLVIDVNQDTFPDVIIGQNGPNALFINQQDGTFLPDTADLLPQNNDWPQDLKAGDLDGDGDLDLVEGCDKGATHLYFWENGKYVSSDVNLPAELDSLETRKVLLEDVDLDGDLDIFLCNVGWNPAKKAQDALLINDGLGNFTEETTSRFPFFHLISLDGIFHDVNGDSLPDLLRIGASELTNHTLYLNDPLNPGHFSKDETIIPFFVMGTAISLDMDDYNGDQQPDLYFGVMQAPDRLLMALPQSTSLETMASPLQIFPNPATQELIIRYTNRAQAEIYTLAGQLVRENLTVYDGAKLDISELPDGMYILKLDKMEGVKFEKRSN